MLLAVELYLKNEQDGEAMKGSERQPRWPAPVKKSATTDKAEKPVNFATRLKLALMDQYSANEQRGYNPYDTTPAGKPDVWQNKPKRV
jgi:hypothetical protein